MTVSCHIVKQAYGVYPTRQRAKARLIADRSGLCVSYSEAFRIAQRASTAEEFCRIWNDECDWQDCNNLEELVD